MDKLLNNEKFIGLLSQFLESKEVQNLINELQSESGEYVDPFTPICETLEDLGYEEVEAPDSDTIIYEREQDGLSVIKIRYDEVYTVQYLFVKSTENSNQFINKALFNLSFNDVFKVINDVQNL